jgi:hypothetical protein
LAVSTIKEKRPAFADRLQTTEKQKVDLVSAFLAPSTVLASLAPFAAVFAPAATLNVGPIVADIPAAAPLIANHTNLIGLQTDIYD